MNMKVPYENLRILNESFFDSLKDVFSSSLESGWYILGSKVTEFEKNFAKYCGTKYCIGVASGLDALILSLEALELPKNSEVLVPSNTYIASILAILRAGLKPVLVEPNISTYNMCPLKTEQAINSNTSAILPVHLYGKLSDMSKLCEIAKNNRLKIVEDCAQAHGAKFKGKTAGSFGELGAFSFYPTKNLGALGDGGAITTNDKELYDKLRSLRNYGSHKKYYNERIGYNSRLDEIQAGFLNVKLSSLDKVTQHKRQLAKIYQEKLSTKFIKPKIENDFYDVYHIYNVRCVKRDQLKNWLLEQSIGTEIHYPVAPVDQKAMLGILDDETPIAREIHESTLSLPISFAHKPEDIEFVIEKLNHFADQYL